MSGKMRQGCFDRCDDESDTNGYASSPCYMHEVDPPYFGWAPPVEPVADWKSYEPGPGANALRNMRALRDKVGVAWGRTRMKLRSFRQADRKASEAAIEAVEGSTRTQN